MSATRPGKFSFEAVGGTTYQLRVDVAVDGSIAAAPHGGSTLELYAPDGLTIIAQNTYRGRTGGSEIIWTCPDSAVYTVGVFAAGPNEQAVQAYDLYVTAESAANSDDPCDGGAVLTAGEEEISFMPRGQYEEYLACTWRIQCPDGQLPTFTFTNFDTENGYE